MIIYECGQAVHHDNKYSADKRFIMIIYMSVDNWSIMIIYMSMDKRSIIIINIVRTSGLP